MSVLDLLDLAEAVWRSSFALNWRSGTPTISFAVLADDASRCR
jgi:hypothetical protein